MILQVLQCIVSSTDELIGKGFAHVLTVIKDFTTQISARLRPHNGGLHSTSPLATATISARSEALQGVPGPDAKPSAINVCKCALALSA